MKDKYCLDGEEERAKPYDKIDKVQIREGLKNTLDIFPRAKAIQHERGSNIK